MRPEKYAYSIGYRVTDNGDVISRVGTKMKVSKPRDLSYTIITAGTNKKNRVIVKVHLLAGYCFYGDKIYHNGSRLVNLSGDIYNMSKDNLVLK